jgi:hypothetical protein
MASPPSPQPYGSPPIVLLASKASSPNKTLLGPRFIITFKGFLHNLKSFFRTLLVPLSLGSQASMVMASPSLGLMLLCIQSLVYPLNIRKDQFGHHHSKFLCFVCRWPLYVQLWSLISPSSSSPVQMPFFFFFSPSYHDHKNAFCLPCKFWNQRRTNLRGSNSQ